MGSLDPAAEEFRPTNTLFRSIHSQPCYRYVCPYPPTPTVGVQTVTFFNGGGTAVPVGVPYPFLSSDRTAYVAPPAAPMSTSPTRSLLLSSVPSEMVLSESTLRRELEVFGDVRGVQMEWLREGMVTVHFYDLRHAEAALKAIRWHNHSAAAASAPLPTARGLVAGRAVWAQYIVPAFDAVPDGQNQGTIVVFNLDSEVHVQSLQQIFEAFGPIKELRHAPSKKSQRFVEFFDIRDAAKALKHMNGKEIHGKPVVIEFSRPDRKFFHADASAMSMSMSKPPLSSLPFSLFPPPLPRKFWPRFALDAITPSHISQQQLSSKKSTITKGSHDKFTELAMASMNLGEEVGNGVGERHSHRPPKRNSFKKHSRKQVRKHETRFLIKEDTTVDSSCIDSRTTVMIKNIPNKYSQKLLLNMLDNHCIHCNEQIGDGDDQPVSSYDFVYLPIDFNYKCNVGYGFVNMTSPEATLRLYKAFHLQHWEVFNSRKICEVTYARHQGLEALKEHFKNSKFAYEVDHYLPVVFSPPRDGRQLTKPLPIVGHKHQTITIHIGPDWVGASEDLLSSQSGGVEGDDDIRTRTGEGDQVSVVSDDDTRV